MHITVFILSFDPCSVWIFRFEIDNLTRFEFFILSRAFQPAALRCNWSSVLRNTLLIRRSVSDRLNALRARLLVLVSSSVHVALTVIGVNAIDCNWLKKVAAWVRINLASASFSSSLKINCLKLNKVSHFIRRHAWAGANKMRGHWINMD